MCHTELDEIEGRTPPAKFPIIPGHQIVGRVESRGNDAQRFKLNERVGVAWIHSSCGRCKFCESGRENLCPEFRATGRDADGGYAEYTTVPEQYAYRIPEIFTDSEAAPLLCAGAIGYRSFRLANIEDGDNLGLTGFGASGHLVLKMVRHRYPKARVFVFSRTEAEQRFARELGAVWAGKAEDETPVKLHAVIDTTPAWRPVVQAMKNLEPGGRLVINAIRKEESDKQALLSLDYPRDLWMEKGDQRAWRTSRGETWRNFCALAAQIPIRPAVQEYRLEDANTALVELKERKIRGAKVLKIFKPVEPG